MVSLFEQDLQNSFALLAVVIACYCACLVDIGASGRSSDGGVGPGPQYQKAQHPLDQPLPDAEHLGPLPHVFVGDEFFPLQQHLMRKFLGQELPTEYHLFNYQF